MYIGAVAKLTGASLKAIRHYEALGLLGTVPRSGAYRLYAADEVLLIQLIKQAQGLGFRLAELVQVLAGRSGPPDWLALAAAIEAKQLRCAGRNCPFAGAGGKPATGAPGYSQLLGHCCHHCITAREPGV